jgi:hypothetical protein
MIQESFARRDLKCTGDPPVQSCKNRTLCSGKLCEMAIGRLFCCLDPSRQARDVVIVGNKRQDSCRFQPQQQVTGLRNGKSVLRCLHEDSDETKLRDRTGCQFDSSLNNRRAHPGRDSLVEFMLEEAERHKRVYIEQVSHGNSERISCTCRLVKSGASGPPLRTGRLVIRSTTILTCCLRFFRGVNMMRPACTLASSESPG